MTKAHSYDYIKSGVEDKGYSLLSESYINDCTKLSMQCEDKNHPVSQISWNNFQKGVRCRLCSFEISRKKQALSFNDVKFEIEQFGDITLLSTEYVNSGSKLEVKCSLGHITYRSLDDIRDSRKNQTITKGCIFCFKDYKGSDHHLYKSHLTEEERNSDRNFNPLLKVWRLDVYERDGFTCRKCGDNIGGNLIAHHILPYALYPELRFDVDNGLTLCKRCHIRYHKVWGKGEGCNHKTMKTHLLYNHDLY